MYHPPSYSLKIFSNPTEEPINLAEAKKHLKVEPDVTEDDGLIRDLIPAARHYAEALLNYAMVTQEFQLFLDAFPCYYEAHYKVRFFEALELPRPPLQSVTHVKYTDGDGVVQTLDPLEYTVDTKSEPGRLIPAYGKVWPSTRTVPNAVEVQYKAGFGGAGSVPEHWKQAILLILGQLYENRGDAQVEIPAAANRLLWADRMMPRSA